MRGAVDLRFAAAIAAAQADRRLSASALDTRTSYLGRIPMDRYGTPAETAATAVFLCSDSASYVTGHVLAVDGGFLAAGVVKPATAG